MALNSLLTPTVITKESLRLFHNTCKFAGTIDTQYDDSFARTGAKVGYTINIRKPNQFTVSTGPALSVQGVSEATIPLTIDTQAHIDFKFDTADLTMVIDEFAGRYLKPAITRLASYVDYQCAGLGLDVFNAVGTYATAPTTVAGYMAAKQKLQEYAAPEDDECYLMLNPGTQVAAVNAMSGLFQSAEKIAQQYKTGMMGTALGMTWAMDQNINRHTVGVFSSSTYAVATASAEGDTTLATKNWTSGDIITAGTVFTVVTKALNPENKQSLNYAQQFVNTTTQTAGSGGTLTLQIYPAIKTTGATATVTALPQVDDALTLRGTTGASEAMNLAYHKMAFALATVDLEVPKGVDFVSRQVMDGISMRILRQYDINNDTIPCRVDIIFGKKTVRPEWACRLAGV